MFSPDDRERLREHVISAARADERITGAAITGSAALDKQDAWSDVDLFFGVSDAEEIPEVLADMTAMMYRDHGALHHFDVIAGPATYRVFLLASTLQVDLAFTPASSFGAVTPSFRLVFGEEVERPHYSPPDPMSLLDYAWLYAIHARSCIERVKVWQAEYMISQIRDQLFAAACVRHGLAWREGRGMDQLPPADRERIEGALVRSLDSDELRRALGVAVEGLVWELRLVNSPVADRIEPALRELANP